MCAINPGVRRRKHRAIALKMEPIMTFTVRNTILFSSATIGLIACGAAKDVLSGDPQTSYCEAVCDWAVGCTEESDLLDACLEATRAEDSNCADAESGEIDPATSTLVEDCVATVEADSCNGLTGSQTEQAAATPSAECLGASTIDTYNVARSSAQTSGAAFCDDLGTNICSHVVECLVADRGVEDAEDTLQSTCETTVLGLMVSNCKTVDLDPSYGGDSNINRNV